MSSKKSFGWGSQESSVLSWKGTETLHPSPWLGLLTWCLEVTLWMWGDRRDNKVNVWGMAKLTFRKHLVPHQCATWLCTSCYVRDRPVFVKSPLDFLLLAARHNPKRSKILLQLFLIHVQFMANFKIMSLIDPRLFFTGYNVLLKGFKTICLINF